MSRKRLGALIMLALLALVIFKSSSPSVSWRVWQPDELPVAFWAWHNAAPGEQDLQRAIEMAKARTLFLRAGQIDYENGNLRRIRSVAGAFPRNIDLHLVYNATRSCLQQLEGLNPQDIAAVILKAYQEDAGVAMRDGSLVSGLQLDIDVPTRLLSRYEQTLKILREKLPAGIRLSITGLPTWMESKELIPALAAVDFWIPQFYGAVIPDRIDKALPITSPQLVERETARARNLGRPFYAGLSAYGCALHYSREGNLLALRGDLDPALIASNPNFKLVERGQFQSGDAGRPTGEWRYVYRALRDCPADGMSVLSGEAIVLDVPGSESLRQAARIARVEGGDNLLGICVFRLPGRNDPTTLTIDEIACALADIDAKLSFNVEINAEQVAKKGSDSKSETLVLALTNAGTTATLLGEGALTVLAKVPQGSVSAVLSQGFVSSESLCSGINNPTNEAIACSLRRADLVKLSANYLRPGARLTARLKMTGDWPTEVPVELSAAASDGRIVREIKLVKVRNGAGQ